MAVLVMRAVVNYFEVNDFLSAARRYNDVRERLGLPRYRFFGGAGGGRVNEVLAVAEFPTVADIDAADDVLGHPDAREVLREMYHHIVPGSVWEHRFDEL